MFFEGSSVIMGPYEAVNDAFQPLFKGYMVKSKFYKRFIIKFIFYFIL